MKFVELTQGSKEWLAHRSRYRNASEAGSIMGVDPFRTKYKLWLEKQGESTFFGNVATEHGHNMEPIARAAAEKYLKATLEPVVANQGEYSASLDAYGRDENRQTYNVEIKCPYKGVDSATWKSVIKGEIPEHYMWQLVHQHYVVPTDYSYLFVFIEPGVFKCLKFSPKPSEKKKLIKAWDDFCANPPEPDWIEIDDEKIAMQLGDHKLLAERIKTLTEEKKAIETFLKTRIEKNSTCNNAQITFFEKKGSVDYSIVPQLEGVNLEKYRKKAAQQMKITHKEAE